MRTNWARNLLATGLALATPATAMDAGAPPPTAQPKSPRPSKTEWRAAAVETTARKHGHLAARCSIVRVREWLRVSCDGFRVAAITHLGGASAHELMALTPPDARGLPASGEVSFPLTTGETRALLFWTLGEGYDGPLTVIPAVVVQTDLLGSSPRLSLHDALHEPVRTAASEKRAAEKNHEAEHRNQ